MARDDVWSPGEAGAAEASETPGEASYGEGLWINQAFSLETALRLGWALLVERPLPLLVLGAGLWLVANLPTFLSLPGDLAVGVLEGMGESDGATVIDLANTLFTLLLYAIVFPLQWGLITGALRALARSLATDRFAWSDLWAPRTTLMVILYRLLIGVIGVAVLAGVAMPFALGAALLLGLGDPVGGPVAVFADPSAGLPFFAVLGVGLLVAFACWLWVWLPLTLGTLAVALDDVGPLDGLGVGWRAGRGARATLFVYGLVMMVLTLLGCCLFLIGQVPVYALFLGATTVAWVLYSQPEEAVRSMPFFERHPPRWY